MRYSRSAVVLVVSAATAILASQLCQGLAALYDMISLPGSALGALMAMGLWIFAVVFILAVKIVAPVLVAITLYMLRKPLERVIATILAALLAGAVLPLLLQSFFGEAEESCCGGQTARRRPSSKKRKRLERARLERARAAFHVAHTQKEQKRESPSRARRRKRVEALHELERTRHIPPANYVRVLMDKSDELQEERVAFTAARELQRAGRIDPHVKLPRKPPGTPDNI